jgi:hypothetical protein
MVMAVNPDPKPGRWILPLVILAMVGFTYFFVGALPAAEPDPTIPVAVVTTTTLGETTETTVPSSGGGPVDAETQAYLDELDAINAELQVLDTEMVAVNAGFDADPREIPFGDAEIRLEAVAVETQVLADRVTALSVPVGLEANQEALKTAIDFCAGAAEDALSGLRSTDSGESRQTAVEAYTTSAGDFANEVQNTKIAAGAE